MAFSRAKKSRLKCIDFSRKGEIDQFIVGLVDIINNHESYFTTSSCSGRIILFSESFDEHAVRKKGCQWLFVSHESASTAEIHQAAVASGFRNSGITIGNGGKIMTAVRSTHGLEVPLTKEGRLLVSEEYIDFIVSLANSKMKENFTRIEKFQNTLQVLFREDEKSETDPHVRKNKHGRRIKELHSAKHKLTQTQANDSGKYVDTSQCDGDEILGNVNGHRIDLRNTGDSESYCDVLTDLQDFAFIFDDSDEKT